MVTPPRVFSLLLAVRVLTADFPVIVIGFLLPGGVE